VKCSDRLHALGGDLGQYGHAAAVQLRHVRPVHAAWRGVQPVEDLLQRQRRRRLRARSVLRQGGLRHPWVTSSTAVLRKNSGRDAFQAVVVVQATDTSADKDALALSQAVTGQHRAVGRLVRYARTQGGMRAFTVVVRNPLRQDPTQMALVEWNHPIETLASSRPNESLAVRVGLRRPHRRPQHLQRHRTKGIVDGGCEDVIAIVDEEPKGAVKRHAVPKLLDRPFRCGLVSEIPVHHTTRGDVEDDEDVNPPKSGGHDHEEVAREYSLLDSRPRSSPLLSA
jgi:hypothetical protein